MIARKFCIRGRVQGVAFRASTRDVATTLGVSGWARNNRDGSVSVYALADEPVMERFKSWLAQGPRSARVDVVEEEAAEPEAVRGFRITR